MIDILLSFLRGHHCHMCAFPKHSSLLSLKSWKYSLVPVFQLELENEINDSLFAAPRMPKVSTLILLKREDRTIYFGIILIVCL